jgi:phosphate transport system substrate-binding protein
MLFAMLTTACDQAAVGSQPPTTVTIAGATAMRPVLTELTAAFTEQHPNVVFDLRRGGSTLGETWARAGQVDIGASTLLTTPTATLADPRSGATTAPQDELVRTPIGVDGIAVILHPANPIDALTLLELHDLYTGRIIDWVALGGAEENVLLVSREDGSGSRVLFEERTVGEEPVSLTSIVMPTSAAVVDYVAQHPGAIGYVTRAYVAGLLEDDGELAAPPVKVIAVDGELPTLAVLADQAYALPQPLYLVTQSTPAGVVRQFLDFVLSPAGQEIVARYHLPVR